MNIRGTDATALAAVTDLFSAVAPARDGGGDDFHRALQAAPSSSSPSRSANDAPSVAGPVEQAKPRQEDDPDQESQQEATTDEPIAATAIDDSSKEKLAEVAPAASTVSEAQPDDGLTDEERKARDLAAESMIAVSNMHSTRQAPLPTEQKVLAEGTEVAEGSDAEAANEIEAVAGDEVQPALLAEPVEANVQGNDQPVVAVAEVVAVQQAVAEAEIEPTAEGDSQGTAGGIGVLPSAVAKEGKLSKSDEKKTSNSSSAGKIPVPVEIAGETATEQTVEATAKPDETRPRKRSEKRNDDATEASVQALAVHQAEPGLPVAGPDLGNALAEAPTVENAAAATAPSTNPATDVAASRTPDQAGLNINPAAGAASNNIASRLPGHALVRNSSTSNEGAPVHVDAARFLQRVAKAFESAKERGGEIRLRLSPPELGALRVEVTMHDQGLVARVEAETAEARAVLMEHLPVLRERLAEQGLKLERFDVELSQRQPDGQQSQGEMSDRSNQRQHGQASPVPRPHIPTREVATEQGVAAPTAATWQDRQLNVIV